MELLKKMLELYSPTGEERTLAHLLVVEMKARGLTAYIDAVGNAVGALGSGPVSVMLIGHMDTVPGCIPVEVKDGLLYGRGAVDAKGPLAAFVEAAGAVAAIDALKIWVIGCVGEEGESHGAQHLITGAEWGDQRPRYIVIGEPSGWDSLTLGYKGSQSLRYELTQELKHRGHAAATAAEQAVGFYSTLRNCFPPQGSAFESVDINLISINTSTQPFEETAAMELNLRTPPGFDYNGLAQIARAAAGQAHLTFAHATPAVKASKNNALVRSFLQAIRSCGGQPSFKLKTGTSDMNLFARAWNVPILAYGPGDSSLDHTPNEHVALEDCERAVCVLRAALARLATVQN